MPDWTRIVRDKLGTLPLRSGRRDEVIEELAQQLESAYEEELAKGVNEQEAMRRSMAQFQDWEKLRRQVFQSVEGKHLPVWEQNGVFAPRRLPVWIALGLSVSVFVLPAFRQALRIVPLPGAYEEPLSSQIFSEKDLRRIEQSRDKAKYARALAFVALHSPKEEDLRARHAAEKAIALDPELTWISAKISHATYRIPGYDPRPWIERLKAWDPENGFPYLLEAEANVHWWEAPWTKYSATPAGLRQALAGEPRWRIPMEKAFAAPRLDFYHAEQFALNRQVLKEQGFDRPDMLLAAGWSEPIPNLTPIKFFEDIRLHDVGEPAEKAGRADEALAAYWSVVHFADRLKATPMDVTEFCANKLHRDAYHRLLPLLRIKGRTDEAAAIESALAMLPRFDYQVHGSDSSREATATRSAQIILISAVFVAVLGFATALWLALVIALGWKLNPDTLSSLLNRLASRLSFAPPALLLASVALFLGYYPYARSIGELHSYQELEYGYAPVLMGFYDLTGFGYLNDVWPHMFWPAIWSAFVALVGLCLLWWVRHRERPDRPDAA
jgi:hypothetical protein